MQSGETGIRMFIYPVCSGLRNFKKQTGKNPSDPTGDRKIRELSEIS